MHIIKVGFNFRASPLEVREQVTFPTDQIREAMQTLNEEYDVSENVIISTCNRTEIFAVVEDAQLGIQSVQQFITNWFQLDEQVLTPYFQSLIDGEAIIHLFKLAVGLDSMVIGETQILGQIRQAFLTALEIKATGRLFNELFKRVITFAKKSHTQTSIGEHAVSISYVAVELSKKIFKNITDKHVVILGVGETGELTLKNLQSSGVKKISIMNRTFSRSEKLASRFNVEAVPLEELATVLKDADILISATGSSEAIIHKNILQPIQTYRQGRPLCLIDIAVPRDIDPSVEELDHVILYDMDDLQDVVTQNVAHRQKAADIIDSQLEKELSEFNDWVAMLDTVPFIQALQEKSMAIQETTLQSIYRKIPNLTEREMKVLQKHMRSVTHQLLRQPIETVKDMGKKKRPEKEQRLFKEIFGLEVSE